MVRGDICWVRLEPRSGSEQAGMRPCIIVSHDRFNQARAWMSITVVPLTSSTRWLSTSPTTVLLRAGEAGLNKDCAALAHQITTVDRSKLVVPPLGQLPSARIIELDRALASYLNLSSPPR
ncbi:type II toxin-antitoxin system PemK/MazF family toxin [bacterium CPR1]|nr:type II toxin-antitoxin system PemK/MazF family toxin [bacterium CPR1]